jgi:hypothetical protein
MNMAAFAYSDEHILVAAAALEASGVAGAITPPARASQEETWK